jgi:hypothetical protein
LQWIPADPAKPNDITVRDFSKAELIPQQPLREWDRQRPQCLEQQEIEALVGKQGDWYLPGPRGGPIAEEHEKDLLAWSRYRPRQYLFCDQRVGVFFLVGMEITPEMAFLVCDKVAREWRSQNGQKG